MMKSPIRKSPIKKSQANHKQTMSLQEFFEQPPLRQIGRYRLKGFFLFELNQHGINKRELKQLVRQKVIAIRYHKTDRGNLLPFYYLLS